LSKSSRVIQSSLGRGATFVVAEEYFLIFASEKHNKAIGYASPKQKDSNFMDGFLILQRFCFAEAE